MIALNPVQFAILIIITTVIGTLVYLYTFNYVIKKYHNARKAITAGILVAVIPIILIVAIFIKASIIITALALFITLLIFIILLHLSQLTPWQRKQ